jgi:hypothetical protein
MTFGVSWVLLVLLVVPEIIQSTFIPMSNPSSSPTSVAQMSTDDDVNNHKGNDHLHLQYHISNPRSCILQVGVSAGRLCGVANTHMLDNPKQQAPQSSDKTVVLVLTMSELLQDLWQTSQSLHLNISVAIRNKLALNNKKYPAELCKVSSSENK